METVSCDKKRKREKAGFPILMSEICSLDIFKTKRQKKDKGQKHYKDEKRIDFSNCFGPFQNPG